MSPTDVFGWGSDPDVNTWATQFHTHFTRCPFVQSLQPNSEPSKEEQQKVIQSNRPNHPKSFAIQPYGNYLPALLQDKDGGANSEGIPATRAAP